MTALARNTPRATKGDIKPKSYPVAADEILFNGSITMVGDDGYLYAAAALAANRGSPGVALEHVDNTGGVDGAKYCVVGSGLFELPVTSTAQGEVGDIVYASTDNDTSNTLGANEPIVGVIEEFTSSSRAYVRAGPLAQSVALIDTDT